MKQRSITIDFHRRSSGYEIVIGSDLLSGCGRWARKCLGKDTAKIIVVSNPTVFALYGKQAEQRLHAAGFIVEHFLVKDGERHKSLRSAEAALRVFAEHNVSRTDAVVTLGGGVVGDLAGFAAAIYLRGISFLQMPQTLLSMIDSSVGGKTGVNSAFGKNQIGAFHQPKGVLIDVDVLETLPRRELTAGFCEMIKHAAISGRALLKQTDEFLTHLSVGGGEKGPGSQISNFKSEIVDLIAANVALKAAVVASDERESLKRTDPASRKVLNFGHTFAHAIEKVTDYRRFRHGEAVGYGILFAADLSKFLDLCGEIGRAHV